ncbi:MAG: type II toxin-antitoxin system Phd/YefM family antitoxin [Candidatus Sericytochromatia bacterium]|nr:type II toxin-antitoxin system Phd/YefM family antitoxin [Candidatus Sericytochromatia bacterium]
MLKISAGDAREQFAEIINQVGYSKERIVVTRHGKDIVAVVPIEDLKRLEASAVEDALRLGNDRYGRMLKRLADGA